uniref:Immunoglobulin V-set domain-containing protein n=1 Tax=Rattus norvegicus TaxID=10116 RepID=A0A8I6AJI1_RAT
DTQMTQALPSLTVCVSESVTVISQASEDIYNALHWYQLKPGKSPQLLICDATSLEDGIPSRFGGSGSDTQFSLKINSFQPEDIATYYCQNGLLPLPQ